MPRRLGKGSIAAPLGIALLLRVLPVVISVLGTLRLRRGPKRSRYPQLWWMPIRMSESAFSSRVTRGKHTSRSRPTFLLRSTSRTAASRVW